MEKELWLAPPPTTVLSYLTLTVGDKGIKCLSVSPRRCGKGPSGAPPFATMAILSAPACHRMPLAAQPPATYARNGPRATRWWVSWSVGCGVVACRGKRLAADVVLSRPGACRSPGLAGTRSASQRASRDALVGLPGKLLLTGSCLLPGKLLLPGPWILCS